MFKSFFLDSHAVITYVLAFCMLVGVAFPTLWITHPFVAGVVGFVAKVCCGALALLLLRDHLSLRHKRQRRKREYERNGFI